MSQSRREFLKTSGLIAGSIGGLSVKDAKAAPTNILSDDRMGVLVDTTECIGCRRCEYACKSAHDMPTEEMSTYDDRSVFDEMRRPDHTALTIINGYKINPEDEKPVTVKIQCMHCDHPACVSACIVGAFSKQENGSVVWDSDMCIGCRYCMIACPFQIPAFEYEKAIQPRIMKCDFCSDRTEEGNIPACVEICPVEALTYGKRYDLLKIAHERIEKNPERYINHILGEKEVGGTSWLYLAGTDFNNLDFPELGSDPAPGASEALQHGIFKYFIPPVSLFALLGGIMWIGKEKEEETE